jgi:peptide/nickel transport system substrate-binding protein
MRRMAFRLLAFASLAGMLLFVVEAARPARRPHYGGILRVEFQETVSSLDPATLAADPAAAAAKEKLMALVFDTLTRLDDAGRPQPSLASSWSVSADRKTWTFVLRDGVKFTDGKALSPAEIAPALRGIHLDWQVTGGVTRSGAISSSWIEISTSSPQPDIPVILAAANNLIVRRGEGLTPAGTGPFRVSEWQPGRRAVFAANEDYWEGRPFLDAIEVQMGRAAREQLIDLEVGKADLVEIPPEQARRAAEHGTRIWGSAPAQLLALVFSSGRPLVEDQRVRESLANSIDRTAMVNFVLQKEGEPAGGFLPQWLSGHEFLFSTAAGPARGREIISQISPLPSTLLLGYDSSGPLEQAVAERIAVNAGDAGIRVSTKGLGAGQTAGVDARVVRLRMVSPDPREALAGYFSSLGVAAAWPSAGAGTPEDLYEREREALENYRIVPLVHLPEVFGLSSQVKDWVPARWGEWRLADVWLEAAAGPPTAGGLSRPHPNDMTGSQERMAGEKR